MSLLIKGVGGGGEGAKGSLNQGGQKGHLIKGGGGAKGSLNQGGLPPASCVLG